MEGKTNIGEKGRVRGVPKPRPLQSYTTEELKTKILKHEITLEQYYDEMTHRGVSHA